MKHNTLYSTIEIKSADSGEWRFTGLASSPAPDRMRDTVDSEGATYKLPIPLLWQHSHDAPIGHVTEATVSKDGIAISATITQPTDDMPAGLSSRLQEAWASIKSGLVRGLSIGFAPLEFTPNKDGGMHIAKWHWMELSAVTIPANQDASIATIKRLAQPGITCAAHGGFPLNQTHFNLRNR
jgi:HK97 family phage prohead protease